MAREPDLDTLQAWLTDVLGEAPSDWEVTPCTVGILKSLYCGHQLQEQLALVEMEALVKERAEYQAEVNRLGQGAIQRGVGERMNRGPGQGYLTTLVELCNMLGVPSIQGGGLERELVRRLKTQAELGPRMSQLKTEVERGEGEILMLYSKLTRLNKVVSDADVSGREETQQAVTNGKKTAKTLAKVDQYKRDVERAEAVRARNGANDSNLTHSKMVALKCELDSVLAAMEPLRRELEGFLSLPPSQELARVQVAASTAELKKLDLAIEKKISSLHIG